MVDGGVDYNFEYIGNTDILYQAFLATHDVKHPLYSFFNFIVTHTKRISYLGNW